MICMLTATWYFWKRQYEEMKRERDLFKMKFADLKATQEGQRNSELYQPNSINSPPPLHVRETSVDLSRKTMLSRTAEYSDDESLELTTETLK